MFEHVEIVFEYAAKVFEYLSKTTFFNNIFIDG